MFINHFRNRIMNMSRANKEVKSTLEQQLNPHDGDYKEADNNAASEEYEVVEREILPAEIICPDCGGITLEGLDFCDKCGGELQ